MTNLTALASLAPPVDPADPTLSQDPTFRDAPMALYLGQRNAKHFLFKVKSEMVLWWSVFCLFLMVSFFLFSSMSYNFLDVIWILVPVSLLSMEDLLSCLSCREHYKMYAWCLALGVTCCSVPRQRLSVPPVDSFRSSQTVWTSCSNWWLSWQRGWDAWLMLWTYLCILLQSQVLFVYFLAGSGDERSMQRSVTILLCIIKKIEREK